MINMYKRAAKLFIQYNPYNPKYFLMREHTHTHTECKTVWKEINQSVNSGYLWVLGLHVIV